MKICRICNKEKNFDEFHTRKLKNKIGYRNECKECRCLIEKKRRNSNLDEYKKKIKNIIGKIKKNIIIDQKNIIENIERK